MSEDIYGEIFYADKSHVEELFTLAETFWNESNFNNGNLTIRKDYWQDMVRGHIDQEDTEAICCRVDGNIVGYVLIYYQKDYTQEPIGEMFQFYVAPEYRGTKVARELVKASVAKYEEWGCARAYCEASPGISFKDHLSLFRNLWGKFGYEQVGVTLMKEF